MKKPQHTHKKNQLNF